MASSNFIAWNAANVEPDISDEQSKIDNVIQLINKIQERNFAHHRHGFRGTHVKTQAIVKGSLKVLPDLPQHLAQGLFSQGGKEYPIAIRYANEPIHLADDRAPGPRGCGMKVFNVDGPGNFLDPIGGQTHTQDFTFNNAPLLELTDLPTTVEIFTLREKYFDSPNLLKEQLMRRKDTDLQMAPATLPNHHFMSYIMYSQSAYRFGDYIVKYALFPTGEFQAGLAEQATITDESNRDQHSIWLREYFSQHDADFDFRVQLCRNVSEQPIEDCSQQWDEEKYPFETVAKVTLPKGQDVFEPRRRGFWDDRMRLNTWYGLEAHKPLGSANRLRKRLYQESSMQREKINATDILPVSSIDQIP